MPEYSYDHRQVMNTEAILWCVSQMLNDQPCGAWTERVAELQSRATELAKEISTYIDGFETEDS